MKPIHDAPTVHAELDSQAESVSLIRAMLTGAVESLGFETSLIDDLNTAVSEACNNVVLHAYDGSTGPMIVHLEACEEGVEVSIRDRGAGFRHASSSGLGTGIAVISALADRAEFFSAPGGGTEVRVTFARRVPGGGPRREAAQSDGPEALPCDGPRDVLVTLSPMALLPGVLGRMTRLLAARARFSLERFSDTDLLIDRLVAHAERHATSPGISFLLYAQDSRLELKLGPLHEADPPAPSAPTPSADHGSWPLELLVDELAVKPVDHSQMLCMVVSDHQPA
jgi:serine/threonine-protein kinase RsbW